MHVSAPAGILIKLTKNDSTDLSRPGRGYPRALACGTAGTMNAEDLEGNTITNFPLQAGYNPIRIQKFTTGGTADDVWGLY